MGLVVIITLPGETVVPRNIIVILILISDYTMECNIQSEASHHLQNFLQEEA